MLEHVQIVVQGLNFQFGFEVDLTVAFGAAALALMTLGVEPTPCA